MIWLAVVGVMFVVVLLGGFCAVLYVGQEKRQQRHDEQVAQLVRQITRTNPADSTLKAMKQTSEVLTNAVDKITGTIGSSFATATGLNGGTNNIIEPSDAPVDEPDDVDAMFPDTEFDGLFVQPDIPSGNGMISPPISGIVP